jgi:hypothetical protein
MAAPKKEKEIEFEPDAWERFERAVKIVVKAPPMHRVGKSKGKPVESPKERKEK